MKVRRTTDPETVLIWCPGCDMAHQLRIGGSAPWDYDGDDNCPTFSPSLLVRGGSDNGVCHSFIRAGRIEYLGDCTHELAGQTVDLPDWPYAGDAA